MKRSEHAPALGLNRTTGILGCAAALMGAIVIFGWFFHVQTLIQILPAFVPMQFNTALGFVAIGVGLVAWIANNPKASIACGAFVGVLGVLTLVEYLFSVDLRIDQLFMEHYINVKTSHPGRMAPNTALCFTIASLALVSMNGFRSKTARSLIAVFSGSLIFSLGFISLLGYLFDVESAYGWGRFTKMAVHTSCGFIAIGLGIFAQSWQERSAYGLVFLLFGSTIIPLGGSFVSNTFVHDIHLVNEPIHSTIESIGSLAAIILGVLLTFTKASDEDRSHRLFGGCSLLVMGILDLLHSCVSPGNPFIWMHAAAYFLGGFCFAFVWIPARSLSNFIEKNLPWAVVIGSIALFLFFALFPKALPLMTAGEEFSLIAVAMNVLGGSFFLAAAAYYFHQYFKNKIVDNALFCGLCMMLCIAGLTFPISHLWCADWWLWHFYKLIAFILVLIYVFVLYSRTQKEVQTLNRSLNLQLKSLTQINDELKNANSELNRKNQELDEFTYVASHDLQEPLRKLVSFSALLPKDIEGDLSQNAQKDLLFITDAAKRMQKLVQDLLELSRTSRWEIKPELIPLDEIVDESLISLDGRITETGASIERDELPTLTCDRRMMIQLFQNLIGNALKFGQKDTKTTIQITANWDESGWIVGVKDNGIGIAANHCEQIFQPFKRLHGRAEYEGSGIGLSICRKIIERHRGTIWVESELEQGSHFKFTIE